MTDPTETNRILAARHEFAHAFGDLAKGKRNWQLAAFALMGVLTFETAGLLRLAATARVTPYVVEVDKLGRAEAVGPAEPFRAPAARLVAAQLARFVHDVRTVTPSEAVEADLMREAYGFVDRGAADFLNGYFTDPRNDPRLIAKQVARTVEVTSVLPVPHAGTSSSSGTSTWKVQWTETDHPVVGATTSGGSDGARTAAWESYLTVRVAPPATADAIELNPLGIYVTGITWTRIGGSS